jgi:hypothetical protein
VRGMRRDRLCSWHDALTPTLPRPQIRAELVKMANGEGTHDSVIMQVGRGPS